MKSWDNHDAEPRFLLAINNIHHLIHELIIKKCLKDTSISLKDAFPIIFYFSSLISMNRVIKQTLYNIYYELEIILSTLHVFTHLILKTFVLG